VEAPAAGGDIMKTREFIRHFDDSRIVEAIKAAESQTSGEIRVFVTYRRRKASLMDRAAARFEKLGMTATRDRNAVLLYFAPLDCGFAIIGDTGIHEKCPPGFWEEIVRELGAQFSKGVFTEAVVDVIRKTGAVLALHFPRRPDDKDELPNTILRD
jgi:uncharacterized membrane protein